MSAKKSPLVPRPGIMQISPYVGGDHKIPGVEKPIVLASNENPLGPSPKAIAAYEAAKDDLCRYPEGSSAELRNALAEYHGIDAARIVCANGSDELISMLCRAYAGPGDEVLFSEHGFAMYPISTMTVGATPAVAKEKDLTADVDAFLALANEKTKVCFIANPNNPTGSYLPSEEIVRLREGLPDHTLLVVDAAYAEYVTRNDYTSGIEMVDRYDNVVMTRTFSKIYALAGLRLGWAYCPEDVADVLNRLRNPFNVTVPAQAAGVAALHDVAWVDAARTHNDEWLPWFTREVQKLGLEVPPSIGNFVMVGFPPDEGKNADAANDFLLKKGIIPRKVAGYKLPDYLRVTIGTEDELRATVAALAEFVG